MSDVSGQTWDIDGNVSFSEQWEVEAFDQVVGGFQIGSTMTSPEKLAFGGALDGDSWLFDFSGQSGIRRLDISCTGTRTWGVGMAFNNLSFNAVPEHSTFFQKTLAS